MCYNDIISFKLLVTELISLGSWGGIGSLVFNAEGISEFILEFLQSSSHTNAQRCLFWHVAPRQASAVGILEKASTIKDEICAQLWHSSFKRQSTCHEDGKPGCWS